MPRLLVEQIKISIDALEKAGVDNPVLDARLLIAYALDCDRLKLLMDVDRTLSDKEILKIETLIARRASHEPVARIFGKREFWGLNFDLNEDTLDPRADSETLIEAILRLTQTPPSRILDLGTGSGCLLLALLSEYPQATGLGIDLAPGAVQQAKQNAKQLNLSKRAEFKVGDWLENISEKFDIIISNPPYIASTEIPDLMPEVRNHDPLRALDGGTSGLEIYKILIPQIPKFLNPGGMIVMEVGQGQANEVISMMQQAGLTKPSKHKDLAGIERCVIGWKSP
ncbi:MAG: peptide chain release factor N(5)-glutamine methyltransferase [Alphaproteobacteria bacterium]|nr:peptide chain release factor N(5)-glutamine methyltransferase [Alphaproteobacteria bacterium]